MSILQSLNMTTTCATRTLDSLKMVSSSPLVLMPGNMLQQVKDSQSPWSNSRSQLPLDEVFPTTVDYARTPISMIYSTLSNSKLKIICTHDDNFSMELFIMYDYETIESVLKDVNETDGNKLKEARNKMSSHDPMYEYKSVQIADFKGWIFDMNQLAKTFSYPADSASRDYVDVVQIHMNARFAVIKKNAIENFLDLPWSIRYRRFFNWDTVSVHHDSIRMMACYPTLKEITLTPSPEQTYEKQAAKQDTKMSARKKREFYENPMWATPEQEHLEPHERYIEYPPTPITNQNERLVFGTPSP